MPKPVLVIDHDKNDLSKIARYLKNHGYETITTHKAQKGIDLFFEYLPGIVFINTLMPGINGALIAKRLKSSHEGMRTPIFMLSPLVTGASRSEFHNWSDGVVKKPVQLGDVLFVVEKALGPGEVLEEAEEPDVAQSESVTEQEAQESREADGASREESNGYNVLAQGAIEEVDMPALVGSLAREKISGRLEIRSDDHSISVLWEKGFIVGLYSVNLLEILEKQQKLSRVEVLGIRRRYREEGIDVIAGLRGLQFSEDNITQLEKGWRQNQLRGFTSLSHGSYRLVDGPVKKFHLIDPFIPVHFAVKSSYDMGRLQSAIEEQTSIGKRYYWTPDAPIPAGDDPQFKTLLNDIHSACVRGATLGELFTLSTDPTSVLSALFALLVIGRITQTSPDAAKPKTARPVKEIVEAVKKTVDKTREPISEPEPPPFHEPTGRTHEIKSRPESARPGVPGAMKSGAANDGNRQSAAFGRNGNGISAQAKEILSGDIVEPCDSKPGDGREEFHKPMTKEDLIQRGDEFMKQHTFSRAQECYQAVAQYEDKDPEILIKAARATYRNKFIDRFDRLIESVHFCKKALNASPTFVPAYITLMRIFEDENKYHLVRQVAARALEHMPGNEEIDRRLKQMERSVARGQ